MNEDERRRDNQGGLTGAARSLIQVPLSASVYGLRRLSGLLAPSVSEREEGGFGLLPSLEQRFNRFVQAAFRTEERAPEAIRPSSSLVSPDGSVTGRLAKAGFGLAEVAVGQIGPMLGGESTVWRELRNKLESFGSFRYADSVLEMGPGDGMDLDSVADAAERARALDPYTRVWAMEGLGHAYADRVSRRRGDARGLLRADAGSAVEAGFVALHTGMGLSFGKHLLGSLGVDPADEAIEDRIRRFVDQCLGNSRTGYEGVAQEGLGLIAQTLHPGLIPRLDRHLGDCDPTLQALFWHGIGRGRYFTLSSSTAWRTSDLFSAPHELGRRNVVSGLAWPLMLVNIRHPEVVASFLERHGRTIESDGAFATGVCAAIAVWSTATGGDRYVDRFPAYVVDVRNRALGRRWREQIRGPWELAMSELGPEVRRSHRFGDLFQYPAGPGVAGTGPGQRLASMLEGMRSGVAGQ